MTAASSNANISASLPLRRGIFGAGTFVEWIEFLGKSQLERLVVWIRSNVAVLRVAFVADGDVGQEFVQQTVGDHERGPYQRAFDEPVFPRADQKQQRPRREDAHSERAVEIL